MDKINYIVIAIVAIAVIISGVYIFTLSNTPGVSTNLDASALENRGNLVVDGGSQNLENGLYESNISDNNSVLATNSSVLTLANSIINKTGDTQTQGDACDFYGVNSAVLVRNSAHLDIGSCQIVTNSTGSNGVFVTNSAGESQQGGGEGQTPPGGPLETSISTSQVNDSAVANIENVEITTYQDKSRGLDATFGGIINANNIVINTNGNSCAAVATDRGEGTVNVTNSHLNTGVSKESGRGSPIIYSTGNINIENSRGTAYVSQIACIEGKNSITMHGSSFNCFAEGNRKDGDNYVDLGGIFIYQSMSGDADVGTATFNCSDCELSIDSNSSYYSQAPMFHVTNTRAVINLESTRLNFGSGILADISGQNQWGNVGSNGGDLTFNIIECNLNGNITVDEISSLNLTLNKTTFEGAINSTGNTSVIINEGSTWTLTGDSYVTSLVNNGNINYNGHSIYVNGVAQSE